MTGTVWSRPVWTALRLVATLLVAGCGDDTEPTETPKPLLAGPFASAFSLSAATLDNLPEELTSITPTAKGHFYWFLPEASGRELTVQIVAQSTAALAEGTLVHEESQRMGADDRQGFVTVQPASFSRGGGRRNAAGRLEWVPGLYSIRVVLSDATALEMPFQVR